MLPSKPSVRGCMCSLSCPPRLQDPMGSLPSLCLLQHTQPVNPTLTSTLGCLCACFAGPNGLPALPVPLPVRRNSRVPDQPHRSAHSSLPGLWRQRSGAGAEGLLPRACCQGPAARRCVELHEGSSLARADSAVGLGSGTAWLVWQVTSRNARPALASLQPSHPTKPSNCAGPEAARDA